MTMLLAIHLLCGHHLGLGRDQLNHIETWLCICMPQWNGSSVVQVEASCPFIAKTLSLPIRTYCQLAKITEIWIKMKKFSFKELLWKCCLQNVSHFVQMSSSWLEHQEEMTCVNYYEHMDGLKHWSDVSFALTHWGRDKMDAISQTTFSCAFSSMKTAVFWLNFHWNMFARVQLTIIQHWLR